VTTPPRSGETPALPSPDRSELTARYTFDLWGGEAFGQAAVIHQGDRRVDLRVAQNDTVGDLKAYTLTDLSVGFSRDNWSVDVFLKNAFDNRAELARFTECKIETCGAEPYTVVTQPRTFGIRFSQDF